MSRTTPEVLLTNNQFPETRVMVAKGLFVVLYKGKPFNLSTDRKPENQPCIYQRTAYPNRRPAENLALKLNTMFDCLDFQVFDVEFV